MNSKRKITITGLILASVAGLVALALSLGPGVLSVKAFDTQGGQLHVTKNCSYYTGSPGSYCTITSSNVPAIKVGAYVFYDQAAGIPGIPTAYPPTTPPTYSDYMLDSNVLLYVGTGDWAVGRCTLSANTNLGLCTFSDGVGMLKGFHARLGVTPVGPSSPSTVNYHWDGPYSLGTEGN
jgi:hypothetical protein